MCLDLGDEFDKPIEIKSHASAAIRIVNRISLGKVRHIEVTQLWAQEKVSEGEILVTKAKTEENLVDTPTKPAPKEIESIHIRAVGREVRQDRHSTAPVSEYRKVATDDGVDDWVGGPEGDAGVMTSNYRPPLADVIQCATRAVHYIIDVARIWSMMVVMGTGDEDDEYQHQLIFEESSASACSRCWQGRAAVCDPLAYAICPGWPPRAAEPNSYFDM